MRCYKKITGYTVTEVPTWSYTNSIVVSGLKIGYTTSDGADAIVTDVVLN